MARSGIRSRRSAAQLHAVASVEREIRATDPHLRRKYLQEFSAAYSRYESVLKPEQLREQLLAPDILLVGDYHALPRSQSFAAELLETLSSYGHQVVLGLEMIYARDQSILDEWSSGEINEQELRQRIRYDVEWGYEWDPIRDLLVRARSAGATVRGVDCRPRGDLRRIGGRDRHAAAKIAEMREEHPAAKLVVLFGESHLAPNHLPKLLRDLVGPQCRVLTVLQNLDALYWQASGEPGEPVSAVRVDAGTVCVLNATPLEKYESYRQCLDRWRCDKPGHLDVAPAFYNLIDALQRFLHIDQYATPGAAGPRFLVDLLPEVVQVAQGAQLGRTLRRKDVGEGDARRLQKRLEEHGSCYVPRVNKLYVSHFELRTVADAAAEFVCLSTWGEVGPREMPSAGEDAFYRACLRGALVEYGAHVLFPGRPLVRERDLYALYSQTQEQVSGYEYGEYMRMLDFMVMHRDFECNAQQYNVVPELIAEGRAYTGEKFVFATEWLGHLLGSELYEAYIGGRVGKRTVRALFRKDIGKEGEAKAAYFRLARICHGRRAKLTA
jgi:DNA-binding transcriptional regulator YdaS (Cro superfamily)